MGIVLAATPIGNDDDISYRFRQEIERADIIAAEDTRRFLNLASRLKLDFSARVLSYYEHNEKERGEYLVEEARHQHIVLVTDAGMPSVSDPGYRLVRRAYDAGVGVTVAPGASAVLTALAISGIASDRFCFEGFLPRKNSERETFLATLAHETRTMVFFESPRRLAATLSAMVEVFGEERESAVCRELTKVHEEVYRGNLGRVRNYFSDEVRGEIVIVVSGYVCEKEAEVTPDLIEQVEELTTLGLRAKDAARFVAVHNAQRPKHLYEEFLRSKTP